MPVPQYYGAKGGSPGRVIQSGPVSAGNIAIFLATGIIADGGPPGGGGSVATVETGIVATGSSQPDAFPLLADWNEVAVVPSGAGVALRMAVAGVAQWIFNAGANPLKVYAESGSGAVINNQLTGGAFTIMPNSGAEFRGLTELQWYSTS